MPPVEDHEVHEKVKINTNTPYGCFNVLRNSEGYIGSPWGSAKFVKFRMSRECRYDMSLIDPRCESCNYRGSGEAYSAKVRANGA